MKARIVNVAPETNPGKIAKLDALHLAYTEYAKLCLAKMIEARVPSLSLKDRKHFFPPSEILSIHLVNGARDQVTHLVETWVKSLHARKLKTRIKRDKSFTEQQKIELYCCGKYLVTKPGKLGKGTISQAMINLFWSWVWDPEISGKPPTITERFPIMLSGLACSFGPSKEAGHFELWIKVSCLDRGYRVEIPLSPNPYIKKAAKLASTVLAKKRYGVWTFQFVDKAEEAKIDGSQGTLGLDVGLNSIASTSDGRLYGTKFKPRFDKLYKKVKACRSNRYRQGLKDNSPRLERLEQRLTGMVKTEIGKTTTRLVKDFPGHTFIIEDLDLRGCKGQKRFAYRQLHKSLESKAVVKTVNSAYTSQTCPSCGFVSRKNRSGIKFHCRSCGRRSHADVVGGINLLRRSEDKQVGLHDHYADVGTFLKARYRHKRYIASVRCTDELLGFSQELTTRVPQKGSGTALKPRKESVN